MSRIYRSLPPKGTKIGIAFSGGLDTRCAVAWLSRQGIEVHAYTADLAQPDEKDPAAILPVAERHGAVSARLVDCKVPSDAGASVGGCPRGLEWVIANRRTLWAGLPPGSKWQGIDVVSMSLGSVRTSRPSPPGNSTRKTSSNSRAVSE